MSTINNLFSSQQQSSSLSTSLSSEPILIYVGNNKDEQLKLFSIMKQRGFNQLTIIENLINFGNCLLFVDNLKEPNVVFSFVTINGFIKIFTNDNNHSLQIAEKIINSIDWDYGFLNKKSNSFKNEIDIDHLINNVKYNGALKYYSSENKIETLIFREVKNEYLSKVIVNAIEKNGNYSHIWGSKEFYHHLEMDCNDPNERANVIKRLEQNIDAGVVSLNYKDAEYIDSVFEYRTKFSLDDLKWSIDNGFAFGYKVKNDDSNDYKKLVSWNYIKSDGKTEHLFTLPEYRNKGFSKSVKSKTTLKLLEKNLTPITSIDNDNFRSMSLNQNLGFKPITQITTIFLKRFAKNIPKF